MDFYRCEKRFYWAHVRKLKPAEFPAAMAKGIAGHDMFKAIFRAMMEKKSYEECVAAVNPLVEELINRDVELVKVYRHVLAFVARAYAEEWEIISCEDNYYLPESTPDDEDLIFAFTPDVVFRWTKGTKRGSYFMLDFKFTGQAWNEREMEMYQQLPKYMLKWNRLHPDKKIFYIGVVNLLTRAAQDATGDKLFLIKWVPWTKEKLARIEQDNNTLMRRVKIAKELWGPDDFVRTPNSHECKMCWFADDLCPADLNKKPIESIIERNYSVNTYFEDNYGADDGQEVS